MRLNGSAFSFMGSGFCALLKKSLPASRLWKYYPTISSEQLIMFPYMDFLVIFSYSISKLTLVQSEDILNDFNHLKFLQSCFMVQQVSMDIWKECVFCRCWVWCPIFSNQLGMFVIEFRLSITYFFLSYQLLREVG